MLLFLSLWKNSCRFTLFFSKRFPFFPRRMNFSGLGAFPPFKIGGGRRLRLNIAPVVAETIIKKIADDHNQRKGTNCITPRTRNNDQKVIRQNQDRDQNIRQQLGRRRTPAKNAGNRNPTMRPTANETKDINNKNKNTSKFNVKSPNLF